MQKAKEKKLIKTVKKLTKKLESWKKEAKLALEKSKKFTKELERKAVK